MNRVLIFFYAVLILSAVPFGALKSMEMAESSNPLDKLLQDSGPQALGAFAMGKLVLFDPLVGENACHLRALRIALLYQKVSTDGLESLTATEQLFITLSYILTKTKQCTYNPRGVIQKEITNAGALVSSPGPIDSKKKASSLIFKAQQRLAALAVEFIQQQASLLAHNELAQALAYTMLDDQGFNRPTCACFPSMSVILASLKRASIPIVLTITGRCTCCQAVKKAVFVYALQHNIFRQVPADSLASTVPAFVVDGYADRATLCTQELAAPSGTLDLESILLANAAAHTQFAGKANKDATFPASAQELTKQRIYYDSIAQEKGCCLQNPTLFVIDHICCTTLAQAVVTPEERS